MSASSNSSNSCNDISSVGRTYSDPKICPFRRLKTANFDETPTEIGGADDGKATSNSHHDEGVSNVSTSSSSSSEGVEVNGHDDGDQHEGVCPLSLTSSARKSSSDDPKNQTSLTYNGYLHLDTVLNACRPLSFESKSGDPPVHDEHLFIITHQAFELWFKQILFELESIREIFTTAYVNERQSLTIVSRLQRVVAILKVCVSQFEILETMTPLDFLEFRMVLKQASGFQSVQFRLLENMIGVKWENRIQYAKRDYKEMLQSEAHIKKVATAETDESLFNLIEKWLERTPAAFDDKYWTMFQQGAHQWIFDTFILPLEAEKDEEKRKELEAEMKKQQAVFERLFNLELYESLRHKGEVRLSHQAFIGALFISLWRTEPRFSQPYQILSLLMDIDSLMTKFRYAHVTMVHRMLGAKTGTGGSSGYQYLRSTISDRYKVFTDIFNLSTYIIPRAYLPPLPAMTRRRLSTWNMLTTPIKPDEQNNSQSNTNEPRSPINQQLEDQENNLISRIVDMLA